MEHGIYGQQMEIACPESRIRGHWPCHRSVAGLENRGHHGTSAVDRGGHRDVTAHKIQQKQGIGGDTRVGSISRHDRMLNCRNGGSVVLGKRMLA